MPAFVKWQGLCKKKLDTRSDTHCVKIGVQLWWSITLNIRTRESSGIIARKIEC